MLNNIFIGIVVTIVVMVVVGLGIRAWEKNIHDQAVIEYVKNQQEQVIKEQKKMIEDLAAINRDSIAIISTMKDKQINLNNKLRNLETYLSTHKDSRQSSAVLKRTIRELSQ